MNAIDTAKLYFVQLLQQGRCTGKKPYIYGFLFLTLLALLICKKKYTHPLLTRFKKFCMKKNVMLYAVIGLLLFKNCTTVSAPTPAAVCEYNGISRDTVVSMIRSYKDGQYSHINKGIRQYVDAVNRAAGVSSTADTNRFEDARSIFFKLDTLQQFFNAVICVVKKDTLVKQDRTRILPSEIGVRIYYAAYPGLAGDGRRPVNEWTKKGRHTLIFVATYFDSVLDRNIDFDPSVTVTLTGTNLKTPMPLDDPGYPGSKRGYFALFSGPDDPSYETGRNHGELCPPPRECVAESGLLNLANALQPGR
jgi:hypothetical protein